MTYVSEFQGLDNDNSTFKGKESYYYEDIQTTISNVKLPASNAPTWRYYDFGITSGVTFPVLGFALNNYLYFDIQTPHAMQLSTILKEHFHFTTPTDGTGDKFNFQLDVIAAPANGNWTVPTGSPFTSEYDITEDLTNSHKIHTVAEIPAVNTTVSTLYKCKLTRIAASTDEYSGEVYINFIDGHYKRDRDGSESEYTKETR